MCYWAGLLQIYAGRYLLLKICLNCAWVLDQCNYILYVRGNNSTTACNKHSLVTNVCGFTVSRDKALPIPSTMIGLSSQKRDCHISIKYSCCIYRWRISCTITLASPVKFPLTLPTTLPVNVPTNGCSYRCFNYTWILLLTALQVLEESSPTTEPL